MGNFFPQVLNLLTSPTGSLTYQVVVCFSIAAAFQASLNYSRIKGFPAGGRLSLGLMILLGARLAVFVMAGLAWQGIVEISALLPVLERAVSLISLVLIIWMWAFPSPSRLGDAAAALMGMLAVTLSAVQTAAWYNEFVQIAFNGTIYDDLLTLAVAVLAILGIFTLLVRRSGGWGFGFAMLAGMISGCAFHYFFPPADGNYPGAIRLAEMAVYPLLFYLPFRFAGALSAAPGPSVGPPLEPAQETVAPEPAPVVLQERYRIIPDLKTLGSLLALCREASLADHYQEIATMVARSLEADLCLVMLPPEDGDNVRIAYGYDLIHDLTPPAVTLKAHWLAPALAAFETGQPVIFPASVETSLQDSLADALELEWTGSLMVAPVLDEDQCPLFALVLLSPVSEREWTEDDGATVAGLVAPLVQSLSLNRRLEDLEIENKHLGEQLRELLQSDEEMQKEKQELLEQITWLKQQSEQDRAQLDKLALMVAAKEEVQNALSQLQSENERLLQASNADLDQRGADITSGLEGELRLALEEVAYLRKSLAEADQRYLSGAPPEAGEGTLEQKMKIAASIAQELHQFLGSIIDYADLLLGDTLGQLGPLQKKFVERLRMNADKAAHSLDDLLQATKSTNGQAQWVAEYPEAAPSDPPPKKGEANASGEAE